MAILYYLQPGPQSPLCSNFRDFQTSFKTLADATAGQSPRPTGRWCHHLPDLYVRLQGGQSAERLRLSRSGNPTRKALDLLAALEGGKYGFVFGTGMAAETTLVMMFHPGDHLIVHNDLYGGTYRLLSGIMSERGIEVEYVDLRDLEAIRAATREQTRAIWIESPTNPCMNLVDLRAVAGVAKELGVLTICDNTFLSPYFQRPLELGIDIVMHSTTKYINGHSE